jgi:[NiFe] hydrogenase large subunit
MLAIGTRHQKNFIYREQRKETEMPKPTQPPADRGKKRRPKITTIEITGPPEVNENNRVQFTCLAHYRDGTKKPLTSGVSWTEDSTYASIDGNGYLTTGDVPHDTQCQITASYKRRVAYYPVTIKNTQEQPADGRIVIDPITRIEGHLRVEVEVKGGKVVNAWSSGTLFRGIELILKGRNPEDAWLFTQRLCGVCTYVHGSTSVRCVEDACNLTVPKNARVVRNLMMGAQFLHDHIIHFYHLHALDWVDLESALMADLDRTAALAESISPDAQNIDFAAVKARLQGFVDGGQLGPFANAYWPHEAYLLEHEENLLLAAHYLKALELQTNTARMHAIFGGKNPHAQSLRVGGVTCKDDINASRVSEFRNILGETADFIDTIYIPDVTLLAQAYPEWGTLGGNSNFMAFGEFPQSDAEPASLFFPQGVVTRNGSFESMSLGEMNVSEIYEHVQHSWYTGTDALPPSAGKTEPQYTELNITDRYSWLKAPRYDGEPMEVGPLARMLVAYVKDPGHPAHSAIDNFLTEAKLDPEALFSTLGRTAARALETQIIAHAMDNWLDDLDPGGSTYRSAAIPTSASGMGLNEAPRGAVGHWIDIQGQQIANYQLVIPSGWNFGPRCAGNKPGPVESALIGTPVADHEHPVEILRTVHSLDPCIACAVHVIDPSDDRTYTVRAY